jgi:Carboxypeptidase regulatory-like domain
VRARILAVPAPDHSRRRLVGLVSLTVVLIVLTAAWGCRRTPPVFETDPSAQARVVIEGRIRGPERSTLIDGRTVELVNLTTQERHRVSTDAAGTFKFRVIPGDYRVELVLRDGEALVRQPGVIHVNRSHGDADADFVIGTGGASRPRPKYRVDDGLGSPVA